MTILKPGSPVTDSLAPSRAVDRDTTDAAVDPAAMILLAEIAEAGSLTAAARNLGTTQPALSKQLKRLEQALGVPVFERGLRGVQPTEYGAALLPRARTIRSQTRQAMQEVVQLRGRREGAVAIALSHFATIALLPRVMPGFRARWPTVTVRITPPAFQLAGLREGAPDFAVMSLPAEHLGAEYASRAVYATTVVAVVRAGHPLARVRTLAALAQAEWVLPSLESSIATGLTRAFRKARLGAPHCPITCETLTGLETLVAATDLVGALPLEVYQVRAPASGLVRLALDQPIEGPRVAIVRWVDARPTPAAADLEQAFVEAAHRLARGRRQAS